MTSSPAAAPPSGLSPARLRVSRMIRVLVCLLVAGAIWIPSVHLLFVVEETDYRGDGASIPPRAIRLAARHLDVWRDPVASAGEVERMRAGNAEWDFMGRTFFVLSLLDMALADPDSAPGFLGIVDVILLETLRLEEEKGFTYFMMDYARPESYVRQPPRALFVDAEIALMLACRRLVEERESFREPLERRIAILEESLGALGPWAESYPNECWTFDHFMALAALRAYDAGAPGRDHSPLIDSWLDAAHESLIHRETGMLVSSFTVEGEPMDGPEGSTIFLVAHMLRILDPEFGRDQYERARRSLGVKVAGFGYAREWPAEWHGRMDVDSGPIVPIVGASAGSSGLAILGAASFDDRDFLAALHASLGLAAFPEEREGRLRYCASNLVGDAVMLHAMTAGPLWRRIGEALERDDFTAGPDPEPDASERGRNLR